MCLIIWLAYKEDCVKVGIACEVGYWEKKWECSNIKGFNLSILNFLGSAKWLSKQKFRNFACRNGDKFTELHVLGKVFFWWWGICLCKLPCELAATTALFAHIPVVRAEKKKRPFPLIVGWKYAPRQQAQHIHCAVVLFTPLYLRGVCVCTQKELFLWGLEGNLVAPFNCFLPEASTNLLGSAPRGVAIVLFFFFFLHKVIFALLLKSKVVSHLAFILFKVWCSPWQLTKISS